MRDKLLASSFISLRFTHLMYSANLIYWRCFFSYEKHFQKSGFWAYLIENSFYKRSYSNTIFIFQTNLYSAIQIPCYIVILSITKSSLKCIKIKTISYEASKLRMKYSLLIKRCSFQWIWKIYLKNLFWRVLKISYWCHFVKNEQFTYKL